MRNRTMLLGILGLVIGVTLSLGGARAASGPIGHWKFDESSGSTADDDADTNDGTLTDFPTDDSQWVTGEVNGALKFDGSNDYVAIPNESDFDITSTITVAAWIKMESVNPFYAWRPVVAKGNGSWKLHWFRNTGSLRFECCGLSGNSSVQGTVNVNDGEWHHVAGVYDGDNIHVYVDGALDASASATGSISTNDNEVTIGKYWDGLLDDVRVYDRALGQSEVRGLTGIAGVSVVPDWDLETSESGPGTENFTVRLNTAPTSSVTVALASDDTSEGTVTTGGSLAFTTANWQVAQTAIVTGVDDSVEDGKVPYAVTFTGTSSDTSYNGALGSVTITSLDDDIDSNLVGWWKLDDGTGSSTAYDSAGTNVGTLTNMYPLSDWATGRIDGALDFDGSNDYVSIPNESDFDITSAITFAAWIRPTDFINEAQAVITKGTQYQLCRSQFTDYMKFRCAGLSGSIAITGSTNVNDGEWHHVAGVYDESTIYLYVDGSLDASASATGSIDTNNTKVCIGENLGWTGRRWYGLIDDARVYDRALSASDISTLSRTRFWVGGSGNFSDATNHWSATSGGTAGASAPTSDTIVVFDSNSGTGTCTVDQAVTVYRMKLLSGTNMTVSQGSYAVTTGQLVQEAGTFTGGSAAINVNDGFRLSGGTFTATSGTLSVSGNFEHSAGMFTHNSGTVDLDGTDQSVTGSTTFSNLTKDTSQRCTLTLEDGETQTVTGTLTLKGDSGNMLLLRSSTDGQQWEIDPQGTRSIEYLSVKDSNNTNATAINASGTGSTSFGNNTNWTFSANTDGLEVMALTASITSPAFAEVTVSSDVTAVTFTTDGGTTNPNGTQENDTRWYLDDSSSGGASIGVALDPASAITLSVTATRSGGSSTTSQSISWTVTDLKDKDASTNSVTIREGDSLLLTATGTTGDLTIDADGNETFEWPASGTKSPGDTYEYPYATAGTYDAEAKIGGVSVGTLRVIVVGTDLDAAIGCEVDEERTKDIAVTPTAQKANVILTVSHPSQVALLQEVTSTGIEAKLTADQTGTTHIYVRLDNEDGPIVTTQEIHAFTLTYLTPTLSPVFETYSNGDMLVGNAIKMAPQYDGHRIQCSIFSGGTLFEETGTTVHILETDDCNEHGEIIYYLTTSNIICHTMEVADED